MPDYRRWRRFGASYFLTLVTYERRPILSTPLGLGCLAIAYRRTVIRNRFGLIAHCVLPDHLHAIVVLPGTDTNYSDRVRVFKTAFTQAYLGSGGAEVSQGRSRVEKGERGV